MRAFIIRWLIACVLLWHTGMKIWGTVSQKLWPNPEEPYHVVPKNSVLEHWVQVVPNFLPILITTELLLAIWLLSGKLKRTALLVALILFAAFTSVLCYEITKDDPRPCGCSKEERIENAQQVKKQLAMQITLDAAVIAAAGYGIFLLSRKSRKRILRGGSASGI